jgi:hypothetical protein
MSDTSGKSLRPSGARSLHRSTPPTSTVAIAAALLACACAAPRQQVEPSLVLSLSADGPAPRGGPRAADTPSPAASPDAFSLVEFTAPRARDASLTDAEAWPQDPPVVRSRVVVSDDVSTDVRRGRYVSDLPRRLQPDRLQFSFEFAGGGGRTRHETDDVPALTDSADARFFRGQFEIGTVDHGGGLRFETYAIDEEDDPLFVDKGGPANDLRTWELMPYYVTRPGNRIIQVPVRVGIPIQVVDLENVQDGSGPRWVSFGIQVEAMPEVTIYEDPDSFRFLFFGGGGIGGLASYIEFDDGTGTTTDFSTSASNVRGEAGFRVEAGAFVASVGYLYRGTFFDESSIEDNSFIRRSENAWHGLLFSAGARF